MDKDASVGSSTSPSLIYRVQSLDQDAWRQLTWLYGPLVFHWCKRLGLRGEDARDLFQDVFLAVARSIHRFQPSGRSRQSRGSFRGWLWTIARNKARDHFRSPRFDVAQGGTHAHLLLAQLEDPFTEDSIDPTDRSETASLFHRGLEIIRAEFQPKTWQAFWRAAVDQHPTATIAEELNMSEASVRQAKSRVLRRLREVLGDR